MDGYAICMDRDETLERITQHASTQTSLIHALEDCVPPGSHIVGLVISHGSQVQTRPLLGLVS